MYSKFLLYLNDLGMGGDFLLNSRRVDLDLVFSSCIVHVKQRSENTKDYLIFSGYWLFTWISSILVRIFIFQGSVEELVSNWTRIIVIGFPYLLPEGFGKGTFLFLLFFSKTEYEVSKKNRAVGKALF